MPQNLFDVKGQLIPQWDTRRSQTALSAVDFDLW